MSISDQAKPVFESTPRMPAGDLVLTVLAMVFILGGFFMMGSSFSFHEYAFPLFIGGVLVDAFGFWLAFGIIPKREKN